MKKYLYDDPEVPQIYYLKKLWIIISWKIINKLKSGCTILALKHCEQTFFPTTPMSTDVLPPIRPILEKYYSDELISGRKYLWEISFRTNVKLEKSDFDRRWFWKYMKWHVHFLGRILYLKYLFDKLTRFRSVILIIIFIGRMVARRSPTTPQKSAVPPN